MATSKCYVCLNPTTAALATPLGTKGEPVGVCRNCNILVCGHHGKRDPVYAEFRCVICYPSLAASAAVALSPGISATKSVILLGEHLSATPSMLPISISELVERLPGLSADFASRVADKRAELVKLPPSWQAIWDALLPAGKEMLIAAGMLAIDFGIPDEQLAAPLKELRHAVE